MADELNGAQTTEAAAPMSQEAAKTELMRLNSDPAFQRELTGQATPRAKAMDRIEALGKLAFPERNPGAPQKPQGARYELDANLSQEERAGATELAERAVRLADAGPEGQAEVDAIHEPKSVNDYANIHSGVGRQALMDAGVSPVAANYLIQQRAEYSRLDDAGFDAATDKAVAFIAKQPNGSAVLRDAKAFLDGLKDNSPLLKAAVMASAYVPGIQELARLHRRGARH